MSIERASSEHIYLLPHLAYSRYGGGADDDDGDDAEV